MSAERSQQEPQDIYDARMSYQEIPAASHPDAVFDSGAQAPQEALIDWPVLPLFGPNKPSVTLRATRSAVSKVVGALTTYALAVGNDSPVAMDKAMDAATLYLQRLGRFPPQGAIEKCRTEHDMENLLEPFEDDPVDFPAEPFMKRSISFHLAERYMIAFLAGHPDIYLDVCVITSPTQFCDKHTVTLCDAHPGTPKAGTLFFYREPYLDAHPMTGEVTERERWHPLVPQDYAPLAGDEERATHVYSSAPAPAPAPPALIPAPIPAPVVGNTAPAQPAAAPTAQKLDHAASARPYTHLPTDTILSSPNFPPHLIAGELAIRIALTTPSYHAVEAAIKASSATSSSSKTYVAKSNFFTKRVTAALECKAKQLNISKDAMRKSFNEARKEAKRAEKEGRVFTLPGWVIS